MDYYEQFYINKFDKLDEMDNIFWNTQTRKLTWEEIDNMNCPLSNKLKYIWNP